MSMTYLSSLVEHFSRSDLQRSWATQARRVRRPMNSHSTASVEIQTSQQPVPFIPPPGYYSEVMATDSSAMYPMYVPPYSMSNTPQLSMRDPRRFQNIYSKGALVGLGDARKEGLEFLGPL
ncbi:unnamed protein product, partial [Haemonchus placei]|uniref:Uncharacterized protein n=1 Tax=Haemonchus placei TaxID=6290 RepID=A0A0N4VYI0_HAEPC